MYKRIKWTVVVALMLVSPALFALGLGSASVDSYLEQPLNVRVELISRSSDELQSMTAGLASADDFQLLGLSHSAITVPLDFEVVTDSGQPHILITSRVPVNEPVIQILVEVIWASGRMLREYTLFLDTPTFESAAPPVAVPQALSPAVADAPIEEQPETSTEQSSQQDTANAVAQESATETEMDMDDSSAEESIEEPEEQVDQGSITKKDFVDDGVEDGEIYGPVARGETLWGIARDLSQTSGYSINQTMLALQRKNPEAFFREDIGSLKRGAILRLPAYNEVSELTSRQAMLEVMRQEEQLRTGIRTATPDYSTPTVADSGDYQETETEVIPEPEIEEDTGHLELVPPAEKDDTIPLNGGDLMGQDPVDESMQQELARTEEELVNAQQENTYLQNKIEELEDQQAEQAKALEVADAGLANVEAALAEERAEDKPETPVAITPGGEQQPWYAGATAGIIGLALLLVASIVWLMRRRGSDEAETAVSDEKSEAVQAVTEDAEDLLRILDKYEDGATTKMPVPEPESESESEPEPEPEPEVESEPAPEAELDDATVQYVQTEEGLASSEDNDPEVKLDLARAYLSLGDKEAAKSMLDEVISNGNEAQKTEAAQMMEEL